MVCETVVTVFEFCVTDGAVVVVGGEGGGNLEASIAEFQQTLREQMERHNAKVVEEEETDSQGSFYY